VSRDPEGLQKTFDTVFAGISQARESFEPRLRPREVGVITSIATGIAKVSGLPGVGFEELVKFPGDILGIAFNVDEDELGVVLLGDYVRLRAGDQVERTGRVMEVAVGDGVLGRVINPLGRPLDGGAPLAARGRLPIERPAVAIMDRAPVTEPLQTGIKVIDALIPIGRGQRELILGDRQTGKTSIAVGAILNQRGQNVVCVYCAIGQRASAVAKAVAVLREKGAMDYTVVVVTEGDDPPGLAYIAPYAATSIAERFMEAGRDVLIVYDDLTQHAQAYRELSLLLRRPPGREAFPGDIFYVHSRLLERATRLRAELGGGSLTALPIVETEAQNISAYIPTNLISITDGQIYLSPSLFELGVLPAVDVGKSVSRVGGKAQRAVYRAVAGDLKLAYAQFEELETFARFGARLDDDSRKIIEHGRRIRACLKQSEFVPVSVPGQVAVLVALTAGLFDSTPTERMADAERAVIEAAEKIPAEVRARFDTAEELTEQDRAMVLQIAREALSPFQSNPETKADAGIISKTNTKAGLGPVTGSGPEDRAEIKPKPRFAGAANETAKLPAGGRVSSPWRMSVVVLVILAGAGGWFALRRANQNREPAVRTLSVTGVLAATATTPVRARVAGVVSDVHCAIDTQVKSGQICAKIDSRPYQAALDRDETELKTAVARLQRDDADLARAKASFERHAAMAKRRSSETDASRKLYEQAQARRERDEEESMRRQAAVNAARINLAETNIVSPIDGTVVARDLEAGQAVAADAAPLFLVAADLGVLRINANVGEKDIGVIKPGDKVSFAVEAFPNRAFTGEVTRIDRSLEASQNAVVISAPNADLSLKPGMIAAIRIVINKRHHAPDGSTP
jgi:F-type H+/Na+-transporting ATPase subunit alpha